MVGAEVDRYKRHPDDAGAVHGEGDVLGLVEVLRDLPGFERVHRAEDDEEDVVEQGHDGGDLARPTPQHQLTFLMVGQNHVRFLKAQPCKRSNYLQR